MHLAGDSQANYFNKALGGELVQTVDLALANVTGTFWERADTTLWGRCLVLANVMRIWLLINQLEESDVAITLNTVKHCKITQNATATVPFRRHT